jgi:tetratricopeptide (TPR) repeat protein/tRNA A-37 threonylcarbamoyl transferase component Bud32
MAEQLTVSELVEEILVSGRGPEEVCSEHPQMLDEVRRRLRRIKSVSTQIDELFPSSSMQLDPRERAFATDFSGKLPLIPGYEVTSVHGRGGMGIVYKARHLTLNRTVALKMLLTGDFASAAERKRFLREAQAVARLSHPHVVHVYDQGESEGRPYFTMEFVEGGTLARKLDGTPWPAAQAAELIGILAEAAQVAHEAGIVHRDLKPGNILLTREGSPKISDFGLARCFDRDGTITLSGLHIGTPSYMAPEQAEGKTSEIGPAADIYALGAILYEMLTGRPPFRGETSAETIRQLTTQEPVPPSRLNSRVPRDLQTISLQCLNKDPRRRYSSAAALAQDIRRFQNAKPITARPTRVVARAWKWAQRRPAMATTLVAAIIATAAGTAAALRFVTDRAATIKAAQIDLQEVADAENRSDWTAAATALDRARLRTHDQVIGSLGQQLENARWNLDFGQRLESIRLNRTTWVENSFARLFDDAHADAAYSAAFHDGGIGSVGDDPAVVAARIGNSNVRSTLIAALDDWAICAADPTRRRWLFEVARAADPDPTGWRDRVRDPAISNNADALTQLAESSAAVNQPVRLLAALGERLEDAGAGAEAILFLSHVQERYPADFWANFALGDALRKTGNCGESLRYYQAAIAIRPHSTVAIGNLGMALASNNRLAEAIDQFRKEIQIDPQSSHAHYCLGLALRKVGRVDEAAAELAESVRLEPGNASHQYNLALALVDKGELDSAADHFKAALAIDPDNSDAAYNLGVAMMTQGKNQEAMQQFREALKIDPNNPQAHYCLGLVLKGAGNLDEAIEHLQRAIQLDPQNADAYYNLALARMARNQTDEAIREFQSSLKINPKQPDAHYNLGVALMRQGKNDQAIEQFEETLSLSPDNSHAHYLLGLVLKGEGRLAPAIEHLQRATQLDPTDPFAHYNLGLGLSVSGKKEQAIAELETALKLAPNQSDFHYNLAFLLMEKGKSDAAIEQFREAIELDPENSRAQYYLGLLLKGAGEMDEAIEHLQKATELDPGDPYAHYNLALGLLAVGQKASAIEQFNDSLKIDAKQPDAEYNLGLALMASRRIDEAIDHFHRAIALNPSDGYAYGGLGNALMDKARFAEANLAFERCLDLLPPTDPARQQYLEVMRKCQQRLPKPTH